MEDTDKLYDIVVIGSGMGGLACAYILASEGHSVVVLEKNNQIGGNLQIFSRDKAVFDTGVHYIGGLDPGQNTWKLFKYFGIFDDMKLLRMDENGFDRLRFFKEDKTYNYGMGYAKFREVLYQDFPDNHADIDRYCELMEKVCDEFPIYRLIDKPIDYMKSYYLNRTAKEVINEITDNQLLREVFAGTNMLYAGNHHTPFYVHALAINSYIESSYRCIDGGSQIAKLMSKRIRKFGGEVWKRAEVVSANYDGAEVCSVNLEDGRVVKGKKFISNLHPKMTINLFGPSHFRKAYVTRISGLKNSISSFCLYVVFKENTFPYMNYNLYQYNTKWDMWDFPNYKEEEWPGQGYMLSTPATSRSKEWADGAAFMAYMRYEAVEKFMDTYNTVTKPASRGEAYEAFKTHCSERLLDTIEQDFPDFRSKIRSYHASTPLTFRDYIGNEDGSMYGLDKDANEPLKTFINPKMKVPNLFLTGANINMHGILGVSINALLTCFEIIDRTALMKKINEVAEGKVTV